MWIFFYFFWICKRINHESSMINLQIRKVKLSHREENQVDLVKWLKYYIKFVSWISVSSDLFPRCLRTTDALYSREPFRKVYRPVLDLVTYCSTLSIASKSKWPEYANSARALRSSFFPGTETYDKYSQKIYQHPWSAIKSPDIINWPTTFFTCLYTPDLLEELLPLDCELLPVEVDGVHVTSQIFE